MAGLGLMMRRTGLYSHPATEEMDTSIQFCSGLKGDGSSYLVIPDFTFEATDSYELIYSISTKKDQMLFGSRLTNGKSTICLLASNVDISYVAMVSSPAEGIGASSFYGENMILQSSYDWFDDTQSYRRKYKLNDKFLKSFAVSSPNDSMSHDLYVFASNATAGGLDSRIFHGIIHSFVVKDVTGATKLELLPCTKDGIPGMYDKVSRQVYYNEGTGVFTAIV